jgi:hypothetical protein
MRRRCAPRTTSSMCFFCRFTARASLNQLQIVWSGAHWHSLRSSSRCLTQSGPTLTFASAAKTPKERWHTAIHGAAVFVPAVRQPRNIPETGCGTVARSAHAVPSISCASNTMPRANGVREAMRGYGRMCPPSQREVQSWSRPQLRLEQTQRTGPALTGLQRHQSLFTVCMG